MKRDYFHEKERDCFCGCPWEEEKWICIKESRICCEKIPCEKKKEPFWGCPYGYWVDGWR